MCQNQEKGKIVKMLTLKRKMKCHFMKWDDYVLEGGKEHNTFSFLSSTSKLLSFFVSKMSVEKSFVENYKTNLERKCRG
jgi:hypothetical protein